MTAPLPDVKRPKNEVIEKIKTQIKKGKSLVERYENLFLGMGEDELSEEGHKWSDFNLEFLRRSFVDDSVAMSYAKLSGTVKHRLKARIHFLESVLDRIELVEEHASVVSKGPPLATPESGQQVFLVHGHDEAANHEVSRFVESLDFNVIRLSEQPHGGRTLIEKLEDYANVAFVVALLTADDMGVSIAKVQNREEWKPHARQNAIFELGVFVGRLGRGKVCVLYKPGVEIPSDYEGVGYVKMGSDNGWKIDLAREMKKAGLDVDLNKVA